MRDLGRRPRYDTAMLALAFLVALPASLALVGWASFTESGPENGGRAGLSSLSRQTAKDVGISNISPSSDVVYRGDSVTIDVAVQNLGDAREEFLLTLRHSDEDSTLATVRLGLDAGQEFTIGLNWDTANASPQAHTLTATIYLEGDQNPDNDSLTLMQDITVIQRDIRFGDELGLGVPDAFFSGGLLSPGIGTAASPSVALFVGGADAEYSGTLAPASIETQGKPLTSTIQGVVHLEGRQSSLGVFLEVGGEIYHADATGAYTIEATGGEVDIMVMAPGHVPVSIPRAQVETGQVLVIPELTLRFGDGNGDGTVDILDISMAAGNFGNSTKELTVP